MPEVHLYSAADVTSKVIIPELTRLGYIEGTTPYGEVVLHYEHPIVAQSGRESKTIFADVMVYVSGIPVIAIDSKNPREHLTDADREQVVSYARLLDKIAPYAVLCNGTWQIFDSITKQQLHSLPPIQSLLSDLQERRLTKGQESALRAQANRTLLAIDNARDLSRLMRRCHDAIRNLRGYDPTKAFDELSKVLFAKMYEEREIVEGRREKNRFTSAFVREMREQNIEIIQQLWKDTASSARYREVFGDETVEQEVDLPPEAIDRIVDMLEDKSLVRTDMDVKGVAFEEFLATTYRGGGLGQYFTPRPVVNFMVDLVDPAIGEKVIDPSCGSGGFLIRVYDVVSEKIRVSDLAEATKRQCLEDLANNSLVGIDWEQRAARTCKMNMILHGDGHAGVYQANALDLDEVDGVVQQRRRFYGDAPTVDEGTFDVVLTNPPFGGSDNVRRILGYYELGKGRSQKREALLIERQIRLLRPGGRIAVVIPEGVLSNKRADRLLRRYILKHVNVKAVIRLPQDAFKMSGGAACTSILYGIKRDAADPNAERQGDIYFGRADTIGVTPSGKLTAENDLLAIREEYRRFERGEWDGIEVRETEDGERQVLGQVQGLAGDEGWAEPSVNRTSILYDRLGYVVRSPRLQDRFSYTYCHPAYWRTVSRLLEMKVPVVALRELCVEGYPRRGGKPDEEATEGIPLLKVRNITARGVNWDTEFVPDTVSVREEAGRAFVRKKDVLLTSTGEGTIGRAVVYPVEEEAIVDGHISIVRLDDDVDPEFVVEFVRSVYGQIQVMRCVSGSTGQSELLIDHVGEVLIPVPAPEVQAKVVEDLRRARSDAEELQEQARELDMESVETIAHAQEEMLKMLGGSERGGGL